jgi:hypothetical protein
MSDAGAGRHIKDRTVGRMAAVDVETVCRWMWAHCYPLLENLADGLTDALQEEKITRIAAASSEEKNLLHGIRTTLTADHVSAERIEELDAAVADAGGARCTSTW